MNAEQVLSKLKAQGTAQNRKVYGRHGVTGEMFGVSYAHLRQLSKQLGADGDLALALWASGNHDARVLATMVAEPETMAAASVDKWSKDLDNYVLTDAFSGVVARSVVARARMKKWMAGKHEWRAAAGWQILIHLVWNDAGLSDDQLSQQLAAIEQGIAAAPDRVRYAMNNALIAIAIKREPLRDGAIAAARRIGKVEVDHGQTGCKTPDAVPYIEKAVVHYARQAAARKQRAATKKSAGRR